MPRDEPDQLAAMRAIAHEILAAARSPDAPEAACGYGTESPAAEEPLLRTLEGEGGITLSPMFTELDRTESDALAR